MDERLWAEIDEKEPIPAHIHERMEEMRRHKKLVIEDRYIKRPTMIEGIRKAGEINTGVLDEVASKIHAGMIFAAFLAPLNEKIPSRRNNEKDSADNVGEAYSQSQTYNKA